MICSQQNNIALFTPEKETGIRLVNFRKQRLEVLTDYPKSKKRMESRRQDNTSRKFCDEQRSISVTDATQISLKSSRNTGSSEKFHQECCSRPSCRAGININLVLWNIWGEAHNGSERCKWTPLFLGICFQTTETWDARRNSCFCNGKKKQTTNLKETPCASLVSKRTWNLKKYKVEVKKKTRHYAKRRNWNSAKFYKIHQLQDVHS